MDNLVAHDLEGAKCAVWAKMAIGVGLARQAKKKDYWPLIRELAQGILPTVKSIKTVI